MANTNITPIDRETAASLNPLIGSLFTEDTLDQCSRMVRDLGCFLSAIDNASDGQEAHLGSLYLICDPIAAALKYEIGNPRLCSGNTKAKAEAA